MVRGHKSGGKTLVTAQAISKGERPWTVGEQD